jgi:hypothetical protein
MISVLTGGFMPVRSGLALTLASPNTSPLPD